MTGEFYRVFNEEQRGHALNHVANFDLPCAVQCKPIKDSEWGRKHSRFEAMINTAAKHYDTDREELKKGAKARWGVVHEVYNPFSGKKEKRLVSIMKYSLQDLKNIIGELDVWCAENGIDTEAYRVEKS